VDEPALLYGATVFTTLRWYGSEPAGCLADPRTAWPAHHDRLAGAIAEFGWPAPDWERVETGVGVLAAHWPVIRVTLFPDGREWILGRSLPADLDRWYVQGITAWLASDRPLPVGQPNAPALDASALDAHAPQEPGLFTRAIAARKTGNYLPSWLALQRARSLGATEAIAVAPSGEWLETSTGNLWAWREGQWWTPPCDGRSLPGIARSRLIQQLTATGQAVGERVWTPDWVQGCEVLAYSNSVVGLVPIRRVERSGQSLGDPVTVDPVTVIDDGRLAHGLTWEQRCDRVAAGRLLLTH
jgi:4-amino-4-deoxychorismate lyase